MNNNVLILSNKLPYPDSDGSSIAMARMLEVLVMKKLSVYFLAINTNKHCKDVGVSKKRIPTVTFEAFPWDTSPKVLSAITNLSSRAPYHVSRFYIPTLLNRLKKFKDGMFDTIILEGAFMGMYLNECNRIGNRIILRAHNVEHQIWTRLAVNEVNPLKKWYLKLQSKRLQRFESDLARSVDQIWCISKNDLEWFELHTNKGHFIPTAVLPQKDPERIAHLKCHHLGALDWAPTIQGLQWFIKEIWPKVIKIIPNAEFHIAGNNPPRNFKVPEKLNIFYHGQVESAVNFMHNHGISIVPLLAGSGMRIKILQNSAAGVPTLSTAIGAEGIFKKGSDKAIIVESKQEFITGLIRLFESPDTTKELAKKAKEDILRRFGIQATLERVEEVWS